MKPRGIELFYFDPSTEKRYWENEHGIVDYLLPRFKKWLYPVEIEKSYNRDLETKYDRWIKVNFGVCMGMHMLGFINIDARPQMYPEILWNLEMGLPTILKQTNSIDYVFSSLIIDKLSYDGTDKLFKDCYDALKHGSVIRTLVPDYEVQKWFCESDNWRKLKWVNMEPWKNFIKTKEQYLQYTSLTGWTLKHRTYTEAELRQQLINAGFSDNKIKRCRIREGKNPKLCMECVDGVPRIILEAEK